MRIPLDNLPNLSLQEFRELPGQMRADWVFIEHQAIRRQLNGELGPAYDYQGSIGIPAYKQKPRIPYNSEKEVTVYSAVGKTDSSKGDGFKKVVGE
jgi:hypothetical protein